MYRQTNRQTDKWDVTKSIIRVGFTQLIILTNQSMTCRCTYRQATHITMILGLIWGYVYLINVCYPVTSKVKGSAYVIFLNFCCPGQFVLCSLIFFFH